MSNNSKIKSLSSKVTNIDPIKMKMILKVEPVAQTFLRNFSPKKQEMMNKFYSKLSTKF